MNLFLQAGHVPCLLGYRDGLSNPSFLAMWETKRGFCLFSFVQYSAEQITRWPGCTNLLPPEKTNKRVVQHSLEKWSTDSFATYRSSLGDAINTRLLHV